MPGRHLTDCQVRRYVKLRTQDQPSVAAAAAKAGFSTATGYRLESDPRLPSQKLYRSVINQGVVRNNSGGAGAS